MPSVGRRVWIFSETTHFLLFTLQGNETANGGANNSLCADNIQIPAASSKTYSCSPKAYGRYLYIRIPGNDKTLTLCEVEVYSLSKSVNLSSCLFCRYICMMLVCLFFLPFTNQLHACNLFFKKLAMTIFLFCTVDTLRVCTAVHVL